MKVHLDKTKCTGLGICESIAPSFFEVDESGDLIVLKDDVTDADLSEVEQAVSGCPTEALSIEY